VLPPLLDTATISLDYVYNIECIVVVSFEKNVMTPG